MPLSLTAMARFAVLLLLISVAGVNADTIFDNLAYGSGSDDSLASDGPLAASFTTGASGFSFDDLVISLDDPTPADGGSLVVTLNSDTNTTTPGSAVDTLGTILDSSLITSNSLIDLSSFGTINLAPDTVYWIELTESGASSAGWQYATGSGGTGTAGEFYYYDGTSYPDTDGGFLMSVSDVPEPRWGGILLLGIAFLAVKLRPQLRSLVTK